MNAEFRKSRPERTKENETPNVEQRIGAAFNRAGERITAAFDVLRERVDSDVASEVARNLVAEMRETSRQFVRDAKRVALVLALAGESGAEVYMGDAVTTTVEGGKMVYHHTDEETEHILNYIAGREVLTEGEVAMHAKAKMRRIAKERAPDFDFPDAFEDMSQQELRFVAQDLYVAIEDDLKKEYGGLWAGEKEQTFFVNNVMRDHFSDDSVIYEVIWQIEKENGAPKIRWMDDYPIRKAVKSVFTNGRAHYDGLSNTMYFTDRGDFSEFFAEAAHAQQAHERPLSAALDSIESLARTAVRSVTAFEAPHVAYMPEYEREGSLEHEAHREIESEFYNRLNSATDLARAQEALAKAGDQDERMP